jgi:DNA polymerase I
VAGRDVVYFIDGSAQVHRAYFAIRGLSTRRGLPTGATYGFTTMLRKLYQDENPRFVGISFDLPGRTFRHEAYPLYKANRPKMDDELAVQLPYVRRVCEAFHVPVIEAAGFEADDVIATLTRLALEQGMRVVVVSGDKDLLQLVGEGVAVLNPGREGTGATLYDARAVEEKFGVAPERVVDLLALVGDAVDNVPGVAGIGEKGARDLVREFGDLEAVLQNVDRVKRRAYREGLVRHRDDALLSKVLVTLRTDAPVALDMALLERHEPDMQSLHALFTELEFFSLAKAFEPEMAPTTWVPRTITDEASIGALVKDCRAAGSVGVALVQAGGSGMGVAVEGLAFSWATGQAANVPFVPSIESPAPVGKDRAIELLKPLLEDPLVAKTAADGKRLRVALGREATGFEGLRFDVRIAAYLVDPGRRSYDVGDLASDYLKERRSARPGAEEAELARRLEDPLEAALSADGLGVVFRSLELPLVEVLAAMEAAGVRVDASLLASMSLEMETRVSELSREVHDLAGEDFNINSPTQLREVLFGRLGLRPGKKTAKTRAASTAEDVLEELAIEHPLPRKILEYRSIQKLKSTYVDALPQLINPRTGRIHATFHQTVAATGRISSSDPNLQNIPIRTPEGRRIREAFVAEEGRQLLSADYSQIELRVLAHLSKDETLMAAFRRGEDIHDRTSLEIFGPFSPLPPDEQRRRSKMVNYALLYGKTAFSLAKDIGISRKEADAFVEAYFARYPGVRRFIDETLAHARETGIVRTLLGRLRRLPDLHSRSFQARSEAERQAMNTPVQGSAADLIKKAMVDLHRELRERGLKTRLILQIHDELLLETPDDEADEALTLVRRVMEQALELDVPLVVEAHLGRNWGEAH